VSKEARDLVAISSTNQERFWNILRLTERMENTGDFEWSMVFHPKDINFNLYSLDIISSIIKQIPVGENIEANLRRSWLEKFLKNDGFSKILEQLELAFTLCRESKEHEDAFLMSERANNISRFIDKMLRLIKIFIFAVV
jgi:hypothetical protein